MPTTAPALVTLRFEILPVSLETFGLLTAAEQVALRAAGDGILYGSQRQVVLDLLTGALGRPDVDVDAEGVATVAVAYAAARACVTGYNAIPSGTRLLLPDPAVNPLPPPHCVTWEQNGEQRTPVYNWGALLKRNGLTVPALDLGAVAGIGRQLLAMAHVAVSVPADV